MKEDRRMRMCKLLIFTAAMSGVLATASSSAQSWPDRPLKFVVAAPAGS
jgi:tripartite-type tricarboxylate transporter receptor subunit TctC